MQPTTERPLTPLQRETLRILLAERRRPRIDPDSRRLNRWWGRLTPNQLAWQLAETEAGIAQWSPHKLRRVNGRTVRGLLVSLKRRRLLDYDYVLDSSTWYLTEAGVVAAEALEGGDGHEEPAHTGE